MSPSKCQACSRLPREREREKGGEVLIYWPSPAVATVCLSICLFAVFPMSQISEASSIAAGEQWECRPPPPRHSCALTTGPSPPSMGSHGPQSPPGLRQVRWERRACFFCQREDGRPWEGAPGLPSPNTGKQMPAGELRRALLFCVRKHPQQRLQALHAEQELGAEQKCSLRPRGTLVP